MQNLIWFNCIFLTLRCSSISHNPLENIGSANKNNNGDDGESLDMADKSLLDMASNSSNHALTNTIDMKKCTLKKDTLLKYAFVLQKHGPEYSKRESSMLMYDTNGVLRMCLSFEIKNWEILSGQGIVHDGDEVKLKHNVVVELNNVELDMFHKELVVLFCSGTESIKGKRENSTKKLPYMMNAPFTGNLKETEKASGFFRNGGFEMKTDLLQQNISRIFVDENGMLGNSVDYDLKEKTFK